MTDSTPTPGWAPGDSAKCGHWTADQHAQVAATLLDSNVHPRASEDAWDGDPPQRFYDARSSDPDRGEEGRTEDVIPYLAALVHVGLAIYHRMVEDGERS